MVTPDLVVCRDFVTNRGHVLTMVPRLGRLQYYLAIPRDQRGVIIILSSFILDRQLNVRTTATDPDKTRKPTLAVSPAGPKSPRRACSTYLPRENNGAKGRGLSGTGCSRLPPSAAGHPLIKPVAGIASVRLPSTANGCAASAKIVRLIRPKRQAFGRGTRKCRRARSLGRECIRWW
jgi:hypothetical protein